MSQDPGKQGANWLIYCGDNPTSSVDESGKSADDVNWYSFAAELMHDLIEVAVGLYMSVGARSILAAMGFLLVMPLGFITCIAVFTLPGLMFSYIYVQESIKIINDLIDVANSAFLKTAEEKKSMKGSVLGEAAGLGLTYMGMLDAFSACLDVEVELST